MKQANIPLIRHYIIIYETLAFLLKTKKISKEGKEGGCD